LQRWSKNESSVVKFNLLCSVCWVM